MAAVPKNKITRAERGKRRRGNRPMLKKDSHTATPGYKQGFVAELFKFVGLNVTPIKGTKAAISTNDQTESKKKTANKGSVASVQPAQERLSKSTSATKTGARRQTQHKG